MSEIQKNSLIKKIDFYIDYFVSTPLLIKVFIISTLFVLPIPFQYIFQSGMFSNEVHSSVFIASMPIINNMLLVIHIAFAIPSILFGPLLLFRRFLKDNPHLHRKFGTYYVVGCTVSAITILPLAINNAPGTPGAYGFTVMAIFWLFLTYFAYTATRNKDFVAHRRWIMRSYAMTFAFIHVNFTYKLFLPYEILDINAIKVFQSMISWQMNLFFVELYLGATTFGGKFVGVKQWLHNLSHRTSQDKFYFSIHR